MVGKGKEERASIKSWKNITVKYQSIALALTAKKVSDEGEQALLTFLIC